MPEEWTDVKDYDNKYQISSLGRVKSSYTNRLLKPIKHTTGYLGVNLYKNNVSYTKKIHRLVAEAFIPNSENKPQVNHIDEDKTNNNVSNLEWMTAKENNNYGTRNERASISIIATNIKTGESQEFYGTAECARQLILHTSNITEVLKGRRKHTGGYTFKYI